MGLPETATDLDAMARAVAAAAPTVVERAGPGDGPDSSTLGCVSRVRATQDAGRQQVRPGPALRRVVYRCADARVSRRCRGHGSGRAWPCTLVLPSLARVSRTAGSGWRACADGRKRLAAAPDERHGAASTSASKRGPDFIAANLLIDTALTTLPAAADRIPVRTPRPARPQNSARGARPLDTCHRVAPPPRLVRSAPWPSGSAVSLAALRRRDRPRGRPGPRVGRRVHLVRPGGRRARRAPGLRRPVERQPRHVAPKPPRPPGACP